ncbi:hypothetical protein J6590_081820 [Homalodisca vitripennis]|nr:hypothetical protein J6590_081820 [Homalodisca vitripennis]
METTIYRSMQPVGWRIRCPLLFRCANCVCNHTDCQERMINTLASFLRQDYDPYEAIAELTSTSAASLYIRQCPNRRGNNSLYCVPIGDKVARRNAAQCKCHN